MGGASHPEPMQMLYRRPVREFFAEYLVNHSPPDAFSWVNLYLDKVRSKIFSMDNLLHKIVTQERQEGYGIYIASILDNIYKFGGKDDQYKWLAVIAQLRLFVLKPLSFTNMFFLVYIDFGVSAV